MNSIVSHYQSLFDQLPKDTLQAKREQAIATFSALGLPTQKTEAWKYLRLTALREQLFDLMPKSKVDKISIAAWLLADCYHLVSVNGFFAPELSNLPKPEGFSFSTAASASGQATLASLLAESEDSLLALNTALFQDGLVLQFAEGCKLDKPIQCLFVTDTAGDAKTSQQRHVLHLAERAEVQLISDHVNLTDGAFFTNAVWHMELAAHAHLHCQQIFNLNNQAIHFDHCLVNQQPHSHYENLSFMHGGQIIRTDLDQCFQGEHATCTVKGLSASQLTQQMDQHLLIRHHAAHCHSEQFFKGTASDQSRLIFSGKVVVDQDAQKSDATQHYKNLLLSSHAEIYTKPELEIYANDVKCAHGATVGQLSDEALFYLKSRGIENAKQVLIQAFNQELIDLIILPDLKARVNALFGD